MKKLTLFLTFIFISVFSVILLADQKEGKEGFGGMYSPKMILAMASELNLTADQFEKLKPITKDSGKKEENKDDMKAEKDSLKSEMEKDAPDEAKIGDVLAKMSEKHLAEMKAKIHKTLAVRAILTKDQIEILKKKEKEEKEENGKDKDTDEKEKD